MHIPRLYRDRHGTYYLRVTRAHKTVKRSLRTKDPAVARLKALTFNLAMEMNKPKLQDFNLSPDELKKLDIELTAVGPKFTNIKTPEDLELVKQFMHSYPAGAPLGPNPSSKKEEQSVALPIEPRQLAFSVASEKYLAHVSIKTVLRRGKDKGKAKGKGNVQKTIKEKRAAYAVFLKLKGDKPIHTFTSTDALDYKDALINEGLSFNRQTKLLGAHRALFDWAILNEHFIGANPFATVTVATSTELKEAAEHYEPFTSNELEAIFAPDNYARMYSDMRVQKAPKGMPEYYWLPLLGFFTGARLEELASLDLEHVGSDGGVDFLQMVRKNVKNKNSVRKVPVHRRLIELGFLDYVEELRKDGKTQLFPRLSQGANGFSKNVSARFGVYVGTLGIHSPQKVFHSFRYNFVRRLAELHCHPVVIMGLVGHVDQHTIDLRSVHVSTYHAHTPRLEVLKDTLDSFDLDAAPGPYAPKVFPRRKKVKDSDAIPSTKK